MYEHPIKRAGLTMNRIIYSNTKMVMGAFPQAKAAKFNLSFKFRTYENGKETSTTCKSLMTLSSWTCILLAFLFET